MPKAKQLQPQIFRLHTESFSHHWALINLSKLCSNAVTTAVANKKVSLGKHCLRSHTNYGGQRTLNGRVYFYLHMKQCNLLLHHLKTLQQYFFQIWNDDDDDDQEKH